MSLHHDRLGVGWGILLAWALSGAAFWIGLQVLPVPDTLQRALGLGLAGPALALAAGIGNAARQRQFVSNIDGSRPAEGSPLDITLRYVTNTLEQLALFATAAACLTLLAPDLARRILLTAGLWFTVARGLFWLGYQRHPLARATGFAATFHPTLALLAVALWQGVAG